MSPWVDGSRNIGAPIGSVRLRSNGIGTVGTEEATVAGVTAVDGVGRSRGTRGGLSTLRANGGGPPPDPSP